MPKISFTRIVISAPPWHLVIVQIAARKVRTLAQEAHVARIAVLVAKSPG
jgi:hypothetical protein